MVETLSRVAQLKKHNLL